MAKPRKRKATTPRKPHAKSATPVRRRGARAVPSVVDDDDVFIPKRAPSPEAATGGTGKSSRSGGRSPAPGASGAALDDDEPVFLARPGRPVEVQSDWVDDSARRPLGISNDEFFAGLEPRAGMPGGWTTDQLAAHGLVVRGNKVVCRYGKPCDGTTTNVPGVSAHTYTCPYWTREGKDKTPF